MIVKKKDTSLKQTKNHKVYYFKQPLKLVNTDMIETISWIAEKNLESAAIISHLKLSRDTGLELCHIALWDGFGDAIASLKAVFILLQIAFAPARKPY